MKKNKKIAAGMLFGMTAILVAEQAAAELYVSPVLRKTVTFDQTQPVVGDQPAGAVKDIAGQSTVHGEFIIKEQVESVSTVMRYGRNVPLFVALEKVIPDSANWYIHIDEGLNNSVVDWEGGDNWEGVLKAISEQNGLSIQVNHEEQAVGISKDAKLAAHLAKRIPQVWRLTADKTLRENLDAWAQKAGWDLQWDSKLKIDYPITNGAVLTGEFVGEGGVVDKVLYSLRDHKKPLTAVFYEANNVVLITEAGYKQEVSF